MKNRIIQRFLYLINSDINEIYASISIRTLFSAMVVIFVPIYLFISGLPLYYIPLFYLMKAIVGIPLAMGISWMRNKVKPIHLLAASSIIFSVFLLNLNYVSENLIVLLILAIEGEAADIMFWIPFHSIFALTASSKKIDKEFGTWQSLASFAPLVSPAVAAFIVVLLGYNSLFLLASIGMLISIVPLLFISHKMYLKSKVGSIENTSWKYFAEGVRGDGLNIYWPILAYLILGSVEMLGEVFTATSLTAAIAMLVIGNFDNWKLHNPLKKIGGVLHSITILARVFMDNFITVLITMIGATVTNSVLVSPYFSEFYYKMKKDDTILMKREIDLRKGRIICNILFIGILLAFPYALLFPLFFFLISPVSIIMGISKK